MGDSLRIKPFSTANVWWYVAAAFASLSLVGGAAFRFGRELFSQGPVPAVLAACACILAGIAVFYVVVRFLPSLLQNLGKKVTALPRIPYSGKLLAISMGIIAFCWAVVLLAGWPGFLNYDAGMDSLMQWRQIADGVYNDHHPVLHTLWLEYTIKIGKHLFGSINAGIALSVMLQACMLLALYGWAISHVLKQGISRVGYLAFVCYVALNPVVAFFSFSTTKDVFASAAILVIVLNVRSSLLGSGGGRGRYVFLVLASFVACTMRSNVLIALVLYAAYLFFARAEGKRLLSVLIVAGAVLSIVWSMASAAVLNVQKSPIGSWNALGIPMQCLARVYVDDGTAPEDKAAIAEVVGDLKYKANLSDVARNSITAHGAEKGDVLALFLRMLVRYPATCLRAVLHHTEDAWSSFSTINAYSAEDDGKTSVFEFVTKKPGSMHSKLPVLARFYDWLSSEEGPEKVPVLGQLISIPFYIFILLCCMAGMKDAGNKASLCAVAPLLLVTLTNIAGPCMLLRYFLYDIYAVPFTAVWALEGEDGEEMPAAGPDEAEAAA